MGALIVVPFTLHSLNATLVASPDYAAAPLTHERAHVIGFGAWIALARAGLVPRVRLATVTVVLMMTVGLLLVGGRIGSVELIAYPLMAALIYGAATGRFALSNVPLRFLGLRCYSVYPLHMCVLGWLMNLATYHWAVFFLVSLAMVIMVADLTYRFFERLILAMQPLDQRRWDRRLRYPHPRRQGGLHREL